MIASKASVKNVYFAQFLLEKSKSIAPGYCKNGAISQEMRGMRRMSVDIMGFGTGLASTVLRLDGQPIDPASEKRYRGDQIE